MAMKAAVRSKYGLPGDLSIKELEIPTPGEGELLIRVHACTVNRSDVHVLSGRPGIMRLFTGLLKPRSSITGSDFAGEIVAAGSGVRSFKAGDRIMGFGGGFGCGSHAQYFILPEARAIKVMVSMPANITYEEAAACLEGAYYAASVIIPLKPAPGQKALVFGATGAIGSSYVQYLKYYGASITAVCGGENEELVRSLGADRIIDYRKVDFTKDNERFDMVFDAIGKSSFAKCRKLLKRRGIYTSSGGAINILLILITPLFRGRKVVFPPPVRIDVALNFIKGLIEAGRFRPVIDRKYPLDRIAEAYKYVATGQKIGNVIITLDA
ncbi:MAG: NAD(P)-dependent alcohol dehydrogenase [Bacteroidota bacterium]|nr:NAD(P)-dependent alcohol dehydrogenase [Bacteroidota bacterium]MDP4218788.1 NAD(P)-dependent alcohol dehydrogenase [Bacteroidota bacterium]MDP4246604.1 NAD(P)-dependent alcohol dehydrogenase [Bacteroidota bacterium]MDP4255049.1 NAD(P)-dependent alcohol dehydrogenase [Bacteroidota bacterium]MDP4257171.1 NAD(P)-dependent alcohol dehydrogenase [Bacteroidota bacterium]